jgi:mannose-6-phosphate isomerase
VQVHPDDALANKVGQPYGKTECWYVAAAQPGAKVALGLKPGVSREQLAAAIADGTAEQTLNWVTVQPGDMIYVSPGTVHTMDAGSVLLETQQQSDITYRLYDYGRPRPLHLELGLEAVRAATGAGKVKAKVKSDGPLGERSELVSAPLFMVDKFELTAPRTLSTREGSVTAVQTLTAFAGAGEVRVAGGEPVRFARGESVVVPASVGEFQVVPEGRLEMLRSIVPAGITAEPETFL